MHFLKLERFVLFACLLCGTSVLAGGIQGTEKAGTFKVVSGSVSVKRDGQTLKASPGAAVKAGDVVVTDTASFAGITLLDNTRLTAGPSSKLVIDRFSFNTTTHDGELSASINKGSLAVISGQLAKANPEKVVFNTGTMTVGVRGTEFIIEAGKE